MRVPAILACSAVNGSTSGIGSTASAQDSSGSPPSLTRMACTSARFTALAVARLNSSGVSFPEPGSSLSRARMAEASSTTLFKQDCPASFRDQFVREQPSRFDKCSQARPRPGKPALQGRDANLVVLKAQVDLIPHL